MREAWKCLQRSVVPYKENLNRSADQHCKALERDNLAQNPQFLDAETEIM